MITNYFKIAIRNILRHKAYSIINIAGLSVGMACTILILLWVQYELSYDRYHENADRIYRLATSMDFGKMQGAYARSNYSAGKTLAKNYPEVEQSCRFQEVPFKLQFQYKDRLFFEYNIFLADDTVFSIFTFPLIKGDPENALKKAFSAVITEDMARKYFGDEDPIGNVVRIDNEYDFTVTGVMKNVPPNSHFIFNALVSFETLRHVYENYQKEMEEDWLDHDNYTYLLLREGYDHKDLEKKFPALIEKHIGETLSAVGGKVEYFLQPLTQIHLYSNLGYDTDNGNMAYVYAFSIIAIFVLFIACINFMNLSTARSTSRAKEVGVRKVLGAHRGKLIHQFFSETFLLSFVSFVIALGLVEITLPFFRSLTGNDSSFDYIFMPWFILGLIGLLAFVAFAAGSYPALFLSAFQTIEVLTGRLKAGVAGSRIRRVLVSFQFTISIGLIIGSIIAFSQLGYMKQKRLGFDKEQIVIMRLVGDSIKASIPSIKAELTAYSSIIDVAASSHVPGKMAGQHAVLPQGYSLTQTQSMANLSINPDFIPLMGIQIVEGRNFSHEIASDPIDSILINETAARQYNWKNPVGKTIYFMPNDTNKTVIGVVRDYHLKSLHHKIMPLYIDNDPSNFLYISIKIKSDNISETLLFLRKKWADIAPAQTFDYFFLDESFDLQYRADEKLVVILSNFTFLAIFIACLGLFGLASFTAEQRTKEIGIRKALGATVSNMVMLLSREFIKWVLIANIIAWPLAYL
ncbi:MAG: ABC transporter permease, partial [Deltaproteobacteria bacterium]|nr:ABC transporter permease [Deltaproteobacteria bacterium]